MEPTKTPTASAERIKTLLNLKPHPKEGGYFVETYRSDGKIPEGPAAGHALSTAIYYLLTPDTFSEMHRLPADEIFHFYLGDPVEMLQLHPDGSGRVITIGPDLEGGMMPQVIVPKNVWQGSRLHTGGRFALLGTTLSPGFELLDYEMGRRDNLVRIYHSFQDLITALTR